MVESKFRVSCCLAVSVFVLGFVKSTSGAYLDQERVFRNSSSEEIGWSAGARGLRKSKLFPLFTIIRFTNDPCRTTAEEHGMCYTKAQCAVHGGTVAGTCAQGLGVCCQFQASCGSIITQNGTIFRNPNYPQKYTPPGGSDVCQVRIRKQYNICQLRLNFIRFDIDGPVQAPSSISGTQGTTNEVGVCKTDALSVTSSGATVPQLCGILSGQHIYVNFGSSDTVTLNLLLSGNVQRDREWSIEVQMISCNSLNRAPVGCLQYFTGVSGQVESFNYAGSTHLANQDYSVCVRMEDGMRSIEWSGCSPGTVRVSGPQTITTGQNAQVTCPQSPNFNDYITIMGGIQYPITGTGSGNQALLPTSTSDRFCDASFFYSSNVVKSTVRPFILHFTTDGTEQQTTNEASAGFCLKWQQNPN